MAGELYVTVNTSGVLCDNSYCVVAALSWSRDLCYLLLLRWPHCLNVVTLCLMDGSLTHHIVM